MLRAAILGAAGYTGMELLRLVHRHPELELVMVAARENAGKRLGDVVPSTLGVEGVGDRVLESFEPDRKSTRLNSSHLGISYAVFCLKKKKKIEMDDAERKHNRSNQKS